MPDRDIVHPVLPRKYYTAYKQICEAHESDEEIVRTALKGLRRGLQEYGDEHLRIIDEVCSNFERISSMPLFLPSVNWNEESQRIDKLFQQTTGNSRAISMLKDACKIHMHAIRFDGNVEDHKVQILRHYINKVYDADFEQRVPLNQKHYNDETQANINKRLRKIKPYAESYFMAFAEKISKTDTVKSIPEPKHPKSDEPFDIYADIFEL